MPTQPKRGDIFKLEINSEHTEGSEQHGYRPWLIVSATQLSARLPIVIAVPLTTALDKAQGQYTAHRIKITDADKITDTDESGCPGDGLALTEQVRVLSINRLPNKRCCRVKPQISYRVEAGLAFVLGMRVTPLAADPNNLSTHGVPLHAPLKTS